MVSSGGPQCLVTADMVFAYRTAVVMERDLAGMLFCEQVEVAEVAKRQDPPQRAQETALVRYGNRGMPVAVETVLDYFVVDRDSARVDGMLEAIAGMLIHPGKIPVAESENVMVSGTLMVDILAVEMTRDIRLLPEASESSSLFPVARWVVQCWEVASDF